MDELNRLILLSAYKHLYFNNQIKEKYLNNLSKTFELQERDLQKEITVLGSKNQKLIIHSPLKVTDRIKLPFVVRKKFNRLRLPMHMAGLVRPAARRFI